MVMQTTNWLWFVLSALALLFASWLYSVGWFRLRRRWPAVATTRRFVTFGAGIILLAFIMVSPVYGLSTQLLSARTVQKVLLCMFVPPLLWYGCPVHSIILALPAGWQRRAIRAVVRKSKINSTLRFVTQPSLVWLLYVCAFLIWHDPTFADWTIQHATLRGVVLWGLLFFSLLFWWHVVGTGPRIHGRFSGWGKVIYLIAVEVPNMLAGVSIAFTSIPIYAYYESARSTLLHTHGVGTTIANHLSVLEDQMLSGAMTWVVGSLVYISAIIIALRDMFLQEPGLPPVWVANQEADARTIMPGLEHRVRKRLR